MTTSSRSDRANEIERRVVEWVTAALAPSTTADGVAVDAVAVRAASLPDNGLEVRPEDWTVEVALRFSEADAATSGDVLATIGEAAGTVTLGGGEAAEVEWPADVGAIDSDRATDAPSDKPMRCIVPVGVSIPWPSRNDAAAGTA